MGVLLLASVIGFIGVTSVSAVGYYLYRTYTDDLQAPEQVLAERAIGTSTMVDRSGISTLHRFEDEAEGLKDPVPLAEISPFLIAATIATEDASFYENPGVNFRGLARAFMENLTPFGPGFLEGSGGSSITQQLVKNVYLDPRDRSVERKLKETAIALELKRDYEDDQILEWYLNQIPYGRRAHGIEAAASQYFGKDASELTLPEAALLAGLPQAPELYSADLDRAKGRQLTVLRLMIEHLDQITDMRSHTEEDEPLIQLTVAEIEAAMTEPLVYSEASTNIVAPHFVFFVEDQVEKMCAAGLFESPNDLPCDSILTQGALRVTTTIDLGLQGIGERVVDENISSTEERYGGHNGSLVSIRPATGEILTYVGSRDYDRDDIEGKVDIPVSLQSHGSTMKMFTYLTAFEQGWVPSTIVQDAPLFLETGAGRKQVNNWNFSHLGSITVRKALSESVNTAAVRTLLEVGSNSMRDMAHRLGITDLQTSDCGATITLGACETKQIDMVFAYSVLANNGLMKGRPSSEDLPNGYRELDPVSVLKIEDVQGNVIYQFSEPEERQVVDPAHAYMITDILSNNAITWSRLTLDRPAATKTGTSEEFRDGVLLGFTPDLATGVWMGNADNTAMAPGTFSSAGSGPMWRQFMLEAHAYLQLPEKEFTVPETIETAKCGSREETFQEDQDPTKSSCKPKRSPKAASPTPTPKEPVFPTRIIGTPTPTPTPAATAAPTLEPEEPQESPVVFFYTIKSGDTIESIAQKFSVSVSAILEFNGLQAGDLLLEGDVLKIPIPSSDESGDD